jgi:hypothetical protein
MTKPSSSHYTNETKITVKSSLHLCHLHTWGQWGGGGGAGGPRVSLDMLLNRNNKISLSGLKSWPSCSRKWMSLHLPGRVKPMSEMDPFCLAGGQMPDTSQIAWSPKTNSECRKLVVSQILPHNSSLLQLFSNDTQFPVTIRSYKINASWNNSTMITHF